MFIAEPTPGKLRCEDFVLSHCQWHLLPTTGHEIGGKVGVSGAVRVSAGCSSTTGTMDVCISTH